MGRLWIAMRLHDGCGRRALRRCGSLLLAAALVASLAACSGGASRLPDTSQVPGFDLTSANLALARLNHYRTLASVPQVQLDYELSRDCQKHANYLKLNGIDLRVVGLGAHTEDPLVSGYTAEGEEAAASSVIYQGVTAPVAVDNWMCTLYHRLGLLDPNLMYIGFGSGGGYQVMDVVRGRVGMPYAVSGEALCPPPGMPDTPREYIMEIPHPIPGDDILGVPITVEFFGAVGRSILNVQTQLTDLAADEAVPCYVQWPGQPYLPEWDLAKLIALIPKQPLGAARTYRVSVTAWVDGTPWSAQWDFTTR
jgi:uncharacterized protein YkwD